jgi:hypothetical protein
MEAQTWIQNLSKCSIYKGKRYNSPLTKLVSNTFRRGFSMTGKCDTTVDFTGILLVLTKLLFRPDLSYWSSLISFGPHFAICAGDDLKVWWCYQVPRKCKIRWQADGVEVLSDPVLVCSTLFSLFCNGFVLKKFVPKKFKKLLSQLVLTKWGTAYSLWVRSTVVLKSNPDCFRVTLRHMPIATPQVRDSTIFAMINITSREPGIILSVTLWSCKDSGRPVFLFVNFVT